MSGFVGLGFQQPDFARTLGQVDAIQTSALQRLALQRQQAEEDAVSNVIRGPSGAALADPTNPGHQSALQLLAGAGPRGFQLAAPLLERQATAREIARIEGLDAPSAPPVAAGSRPAPVAQPAPGGGDYFSTLRRQESGADDAARNPRSTATGRYQFIDGTWLEFARANPQEFQGLDRAAILARRTDPALQERAVRWLTETNGRALSQAGLPVNGSNLALAHFLGAGGATTLLRAPENAPLDQLFGPDVMAANPNLRGRTAGSLRAEFDRRYAGPAGRTGGVDVAGPVGAPTGAAPTEPPAAAPGDALEGLLAADPSAVARGAAPPVARSAPPQPPARAEPADARAGMVADLDTQIARLRNQERAFRASSIPAVQQRAAAVQQERIALEQRAFGLRNAETREPPETWQPVPAEQAAARGLPPGSYEVSSRGQTRRVAEPPRADTIDLGEGAPQGPGRYARNPDGSIGARLADIPRAAATAPDMFGRANTLRDEHTRLTGDFRTVQNAFVSIQRAAASNTGAGDMSMLYQFVKMLDPTSVVRESEFAMAAAAGSFGERIQGYVQRILSGERLPETLRTDFLAEARNLFQVQRRGYDRTSETYRELARRNNINPDDVVLPFARDDDAPAAQPAGAARPVAPAGAPPAAAAARPAPEQGVPAYLEGAGSAPAPDQRRARAERAIARARRELGPNADDDAIVRRAGELMD